MWERSRRTPKALVLIRKHSGAARSKHLFQPFGIEAYDPCPASSLDRGDGAERMSEERTGADLLIECGEVHRSPPEDFDRTAGLGTEPSLGESSLPPRQQTLCVTCASFDVRPGEGAHREPSTNLPFVVLR